MHASRMGPAVYDFVFNRTNSGASCPKSGRILA
jgi:hypothetical protein